MFTPRPGIDNYRQPLDATTPGFVVRVDRPWPGERACPPEGPRWVHYAGFNFCFFLEPAKATRWATREAAEAWVATYVERWREPVVEEIADGPALRAHARSHLARRSEGMGRYDTDTSLALILLSGDGD